MVHLPEELQIALDADDAQELDRVIRRQRQADFDTLVDLLSDPGTSSEYRMKAFTALGRWGNRGVIPTIRQALPQLEDRERIAAIDALGRLGTDEAEEAVSAYTDDDSPQVRKFVVLALERIGSTAAREKLQGMARQDSDAWIRGFADRRLGEGTRSHDG
ncbi:MAG: HEAT repeat domain-containing protein [Actinomycetota bacterium]|nr:HEAT repeat domain-containing protein [Actinomycetota bacterium]